MIDSPKVPFELVVERLCRKYHKLPSEILNEDLEWIETLVFINKCDTDKQEIEDRKAKLINKNNGRY